MANQIDPSLYIPQYQEWVLPETSGNQRNPFETTFLPPVKGDAVLSPNTTTYDASSIPWGKS